MKNKLSEFKPNIETFLLAGGLLLTIIGKFYVLRTEAANNLLPEVLKAIFPDIIFFAVLLFCLSILYFFIPYAWAFRAIFIFSILYFAWSVLNYIWLVKSEVQLGPGILMLLFGDFKEMWPLVKMHIKFGPAKFFLVGVPAAAITAFCLYKLIYPGKIRQNRAYHLRRIFIYGTAALIFLSLFPAVKWIGKKDFTGNTLSFSSHWYALTGFFRNKKYTQLSSHSENIKMAGQRHIGLPDSGHKPPNIVLVLLESVSYPFTSLYDSNNGTTPFLLNLASQGTQFSQTRVSMPYTTKAFWSVLTGEYPVIKHNYAEAVPIDGVYEGLPSILKRAGYRSAFFEVSKGTFNCAAGFFGNIGFDWAWFRENLQDPCAHLGYVGGDDFRLLKPALEWVQKDDNPFFLMVISSVAHDPFLVPQWFEKPADSTYQRYLQSVRFTDRFVEQLSQNLKESGLEDNTIFCIIGDHGTNFVNRKSEIETRWVASEEIIRVPWIMKWPGHIKPGNLIVRPSAQIDVAPTLLSLAGFDISNAGFEGQNAFDPCDNQRRVYFSSLPFDGPKGFVEGTKKIVYWPQINKVVQYNIIDDPGEAHPFDVPGEECEAIKSDIMRWKDHTRIGFDNKRYIKRFLFSHWQAFSAGESAWAYYIP